MKKALIVVAVILAVLAVGYLAASWYFSGLIVAFTPNTLAAEEAAHGDPQDYGLPAPEEISFQGDGETLAGWYFDNPADGNCGVILMHGINGNRYRELKYTPLFWDRGCDLMLYDHRHHGGSTGKYGTFGFYEKQDGLAAVDWFATRTGLPHDRIGLQGESYGAATALQTGALDTSMAFVAADSSYRDLKTIINEQAVAQYGSWMKVLVPGALGVSGLRADFAPSQVSPMLSAESLTEPVLLTHSLSDDYILPHNSEDIFGHLPETTCKQLNLTDWGSSHAHSVDDNFNGYKAQLDEFLDACVPGFGLAPAP